MQRVQFKKDSDFGKEGTVTNIKGELLESLLKDGVVEPVVNDYEPPKQQILEDPNATPSKPKTVRKKATKKVVKEA